MRGAEKKNVLRPPNHVGRRLTQQPDAGHGDGSVLQTLLSMGRDVLEDVMAAFGVEEDDDDEDGAYDAELDGEDDDDGGDGVEAEEAAEDAEEGDFGTARGRHMDGPGHGAVDLPIQAGTSASPPEAEEGGTCGDGERDGSPMGRPSSPWDDALERLGEWFGALPTSLVSRSQEKERERERPVPEQDRAGDEAQASYLAHDASLSAPEL